MNKLTADRCRERIASLNRAKRMLGVSMAEEDYLEALEIALPVLDGKVQVIPDGWKLVPETLSPEMLRGIVPNMAHSQPISHDEYDYKGRNDRFVKWIWSRLLEVSPPPPQPQTDTYRQIENDGWIEWKGGLVAPVTGRVDVRYRNGREEIGLKAKDFSWKKGLGGMTIIAYRVIENDGSAK